MNILISGGSGFLGNALSQFINEQDGNYEGNHNITWLTRNAQQAHPDKVQMMSYDELKSTDATFDVIINLAGAGIADKRWSDERKELLMQSRLQPTQSIVNYIANTSHKPKLLLSGSAIGWYGPQGDKPLDEQSDYVDDFSHKLCEAWEQEASIATGLGVPVAIVRTGIVIHPEGGMIAKLLTPFKMGAGGQLGNGKQIMSWISRTDWVRATWFIIQSHLNQSANVSTDASTIDASTAEAVYNLTAPNPVTNAEFTKVLGDYLNRPTFMTLPAPVLKLMFGEMATLLIDGQKVLPDALLKAGFEFKHSVLEEALAQQA